MRFPKNYTLVLWEDNTFEFENNCSPGSGIYSYSNKLRFESFQEEIRGCGGPYIPFLLFLETDSIKLDEGNLIMKITGKGNLVFENGGRLKKP